MAPFPPPPLAPPPACTVSEEATALPLVAVIELKWLASGVGQHLHVERMLHDASYAQGVLDAAESSEHPSLKRAAQRLRLCLQAARPRPHPPR
jgi:hypothetical protein